MGNSFLIKTKITNICLTLSSCLNSSTFSIHVGATKEPFFAHESVLSKSPVFDVLCKSQFCEDVSKHIDLPEDDPNTGSFNEPKEIEGVLVAFQELYVLADEYQLFGLKTSVIRMVTKNMKDIGRISSFQFFETMHKIYSRVLNSDVPIRAYMGKFGLLRLRPLMKKGRIVWKICLALADNSQQRCSAARPQRQKDEGLNWNTETW